MEHQFVSEMFACISSMTKKSLKKQKSIQLTLPAKELDATILIPVNLSRIVGSADRVRAGPDLSIGNGQTKLRAVGTGWDQTLGLGILVSGLEPVKVPVADAPPLDLATVDGLVDPLDKVGDGDAGIVAVEHVQIDKVGVEGRQALANLVVQRGPSQQGTVGIAKGIVADAPLGNDVEIIPGNVGTGVEPLAKDALGLTGAVRVRQVEPTEALVERRVEQVDGILGLGQGGGAEHDAVDGVGVLALLDREGRGGIGEEGGREAQDGRGGKYAAARGSAATSESAVGAIDADRVGKSIGRGHV